MDQKEELELIANTELDHVPVKETDGDSKKAVNADVEESNQRIVTVPFRARVVLYRGLRPNQLEDSEFLEKHSVFVYLKRSYTVGMLLEKIRYTTILDGEVVLKSAGYATILGDNRDKSVELARLDVTVGTIFNLEY